MHYCLYFWANIPICFRTYLTALGILIQTFTKSLCNFLSRPHVLRFRGPVFIPQSELTWRPVAPGVVGKSLLANQKISLGGSQWADSIYRPYFRSLRIPIIKMRRSRDSLYCNCLNGWVGRWLGCRYGCKISHWLDDWLIALFWSIDEIINRSIDWLILFVYICFDRFTKFNCVIHWLIYSCIDGTRKVSFIVDVFEIVYLCFWSQKMAESYPRSESLTS